MHCGPPIAAMISGIVMNGPTPTMLLMLSAVACTRPRLRIRPCSCLISDGFFKGGRLKFIHMLP